jgi:CheY-like chemotaxis protein
LEPGIPAAQLQVNLNWWSMAGVSEPQALVSLPIAPLDSTALGEFALMQMAHGRRCAVAILDPAATEADVLPQIREKRDIARTLALLREMSPSAFQLAIYLSPGAFTLPVARLVQEAMFGAAADQAHLADVLLSGLLSPTSAAPDVIPDGADNDPNSVYYQFLPEARENLLRSLREADARQLAQWLESYVSSYIEKIYGRTITFQGLVPDENGAYDLPAWAQPFARLSVSLLGLRAGGRTPSQIVQDFKLASSPGTVAQVAREAAASSGRSFPRALLGETISRQLEQAGIVRQDSDGSLRFLPGVGPLLAALAGTQTLLGVRILWVDDNPGRHEQQRLQLQHEGASIELGHSTEDGLRALSREAFDALITDLNRPFEGPLAGLELIRQVKLNAASAVVVYSAEASKHENKAIALGALVASDNFDRIRQILAAHFRDRELDPEKNQFLRPSQTQALQQILQEWELPDWFHRYLAFQPDAPHWQEVWLPVPSPDNLARRVVHLVAKVFDCRTVQYWIAHQRRLELAAAFNDVEAEPFFLQFAREAIRRRETLCEMTTPSGPHLGHSHLLLGVSIPPRDAQPVAALVLSLDLERKLPLGPSQRRWVEIMAASVGTAWQRLSPAPAASPEIEAAATEGKTETPPPRAKRFRVALAFPADKRPYVDTVAHLLAERFGKAAILYDKFHQAEFARSDLAFHLPALYHEEADLIVAVLCNDYDKKDWCGLEWNAIYGLIKNARWARCCSHASIGSKVKVFSDWPDSLIWITSPPKKPPRSSLSGSPSTRAASGIIT